MGPGKRDPNSTATPPSHSRTRDWRLAVRDPGFTPAVRDAGELVPLLDDEDDELVRLVERALARLGGALVKVAERVSEGPPVTPRVRARLLRAVGAMVSRDDDAGGVSFLMAALEDADARTVRYAASALGKARNHAVVSEPALVAALERAKTDDVRRAIAEALGKVGAEASRAALANVETTDPELARIVSRAKLRLERTAVRADEVSRIEPGTSVDRPVPVIFRCRAGLESVVVEELGDEWSPRAVDEGRVRGVLRGAIDRAFVSRASISFAFLVEGGALHADAPPEDEARAIVDAFTSESAWRVLRGFTDGPIRYRLAFEEGGHRRSLVHRIATEVAARRAELLNDPTESPWEALVVKRSGLVALELAPRALVDRRFDYRVADVPAASHPTIAAALARIAGTRDDDVVWDPFVGSGLELIERARLGPYRALHGTDVDESALEAARANLARASITDARLIHADSTIGAPVGVTLAITNPPMGRRVARGALSELLDRFIHRLGRAVVTGGRLAWLSPMPTRTRARLEEEGFTIDLARPVDMGGFAAELQRATKR